MAWLDVRQVYVDLFIISRASALVTNCMGESTFECAPSLHPHRTITLHPHLRLYLILTLSLTLGRSTAKLLRDAKGLPTYRANDCSELAHFPATTHLGGDVGASAVAPQGELAALRAKGHRHRCRARRRWWQGVVAAARRRRRDGGGRCGCGSGDVRGK